MARLCLILVGFGLWALGSNWLEAQGGQGSGTLESTFFDGVAHPAIQYGVRRADDAVARLDRALATGEAHLEFEVGSGYLRSLLRALDIDTDTQLAVFSKTSLQ